MTIVETLHRNNNNNGYVKYRLWTVEIQIQTDSFIQFTKKYGKC